MNAPNHIINASVIIFTPYITDVETFNNNASAVKTEKQANLSA